MLSVLVGSWSLMVLSLVRRSIYLLSSSSSFPWYFSACTWRRLCSASFDIVAVLIRLLVPIF